MNTNQTTGTRLVSGVIVLMVSNMVVKLLGLLCKIPLHGLLQDQGMGYFNIAYSLFTTLYMVTTAGLPTAITIMISDTPKNSARRRQVERIFRVALSVFFILGTVGTLILLLFAKPLASMMGSDSSYLSIMAISPTLLTICISSAMRGYFQGHQNMIPTAISEITEATGKFAIGIILARLAISRGESLEYAAAYAIAGITIGVAVGMVFLSLAKLMYRADQSIDPSLDEGQISSKKEIFNGLMKIALPITVGAVALNLTSIIDSFSIINCMKSYKTEVEAEIAYGNYSTLAVTLSHLPSAFITPIAASLTPALTATLMAAKTAATDKERREKKAASEMIIRSCIKFAGMISIPCAIGMSVMARPILKLLFSEESANTASPLLSILAISVFFTAVLTITTSVLQAHKYQQKPLIAMSCGIGVKIILNILLISNSQINIYGAPIGTLVGYFVMAAINVYFVFKYVGLDIGVFKHFGKPFLSSVLASVVTLTSYNLLYMSTQRNSIATLGAIFITVIVYFLLLCALRAFTKNDLMFLPNGKRLYGIFRKLRLMK